MRLPQFKHIQLLLLAVPFFTLNAQQKTDPENQDEELGKIARYRDYDTAISDSKKQNKPVLILFQEVPGCSTCRNYGHNVLSNPLMTEAIMNEFIPLAVFNNKGGNDKKILNKYNEPAWNNPVVRIVNSKGDNIANRVASDYSALRLYKAMLQALKNSGLETPIYMKLLGEELSAVNNHEEIYFKMYCFWTGEKQLGSNNGVLNTEAGFINGSEVVKVSYNKNIISDSQLADFGKQNKMAQLAKSNSYRTSSKDEDYYLQHSDYKYVPLTELQRTKINSALGYGKSANQYLSPSQYTYLKNLKSSSNKRILYNVPIEKSWEALSAK